MLPMRARRIENEWALLDALRQANCGRMSLWRDGEDLALAVEGLPALLRPPACAAWARPAVVSSHRLRIVFPRYYPQMPAEVYLAAPVFHPNVNPDSGFVCLWMKHRVQTTLEQTLAQLQRVLAWAVLNTSDEHVVQPEALAWRAQPDKDVCLPLGFTPFTPVQPRAWEIDAAPLRRRLSSCV